MFHSAFIGRKRLVEEGRFEYREAQWCPVKFSQVTIDDQCLLPGQTQTQPANLTKLIPKTNLNFYGYVEDQPPEWSKLDYSLEVGTYRHTNIIFWKDNFVPYFKAWKSSKEFGRVPLTVAFWNI